MSSRALPWVAFGIAAGIVVLQLASGPGVSQAGETASGAVAADPPPQEEDPALMPERDSPARRPLAPGAERSAPQSDGRALDTGERRFQFEILVLDREDQPLSGAAVYLAPWPGPLVFLGRTGVDGVLSVRWFARIDSMRIAFAAEHPREGASSLRLAEITERPFIAAIELRAPENDQLVPSSWSAANARRGRLDERGDLHFSAETSALPGTALELPAGWSFPGASQAPTGELQADIPHAHVFGVARESDGRPAPGARVRASDPKLEFELSTRADQDGEFQIGPLPREGAHLSVGGGDLGRYATELGFGVEPFQGVHASLQRGRELTIRCVDSVGRVLSGWRAELTDASARMPWADVAWTDAEGVLRIPNVPPALLRVDLIPPMRGPGLPFAVLRTSDAGSESVLEAPCSFDERSSIAFRVLDADGAPVPEAMAVVELLGARRAVRAEYDAGSGMHRATALPAGRFAVVITAPGQTTIAPRVTVEVGSDEDVDLGELHFERTGVLVVELPTRLDAVEAQLFSDDSEPARYMGAFRARGRWSLDLPAGAYVLRVRAGTGTRSFEFEIAGGVTTLVRVSR